jgi:hypothetical protein
VARSLGRQPTRSVCRRRVTRARGYDVIPCFVTHEQCAAFELAETLASRGLALDTNARAALSGCGFHPRAEPREVTYADDAAV